MYIAMNLVRKIPTTADPVNAVDDSKGISGCLFVFNTKAQARAVFGDDVDLLEVDFDEPERAAV